MTEDMTGQKVEHSNSKLQFFQRLSQLIDTVIEKKTDDVEIEAIAFMVERRYQDGIDPDVFLQEILGDESLSARDAALRIHTSVYEEKLKKIGELMSEDPSESEKLKALGDQINNSHNTTLDLYNTKPSYIPYIGGVSFDWVPSWLQ
ncbi:hypothetical protein HYT32_01845 [Candidatus Roizmanbacteria bacterium]|nr:hypothetical protein [Candidatus Roizmanbacteria bacterium]